MSAALLLLRRFWFAVPILGLAMALWATRATLDASKRESAARGAYIEEVVKTTRAAAGSPELAQRDVPAQIAALGSGVRALSAGLETCNASARAAAERDQALRRRAGEELAAVEARTAGQEAQIERLKASAARPRTGGDACEPSDEVRRAWR